MAENYIEAENDYMLGMKYKDIATKYGVTINTVKSWKKRYGWSKAEKSVHTKDKKVCTQKKGCTQKRGCKSEVSESITEKVDALNGNLSEKQRLFCLYFVKYRNKVKAYQKAYQCSYENACRNASALGKNREIQNEISRIIDELHQDIRISIADLIQQQIDIARADINDFVDISAGFVKVRREMDGTLIKEIKDTKEGISIKLYDKQKAIDFLKNNLSDGSGDKGFNNMQTLAEIIQHPAQNRTIEDFEEKDEPSGAT